jgi:hypothetical protein
MDGPATISVDPSGATTAGSADATTLYNAAVAAAETWNAALGLPLLKVTRSPITAPTDTNGRNEFYFSTQISPTAGFATQFGSVAMRRTKTGRLLETDLIFNPIHRWLVYHGSLQYEQNGDRVPDLYRVALHEFGHLLGLVHPDSDAQVTIMRSKMSNVDDLTAQDRSDAKRVVEALLDWNRPRITLPKSASLSTQRRQLLLRGTATPFFVRRMIVTIDSPSRHRQRTVTVGATWTRTFPLDPGVNRLRFFYRQPDGTLTPFATKIVRVR